MSLLTLSYKILRFTALLLLIAGVFTILTGFFTAKPSLSPLAPASVYYYHTVIAPLIFIPLFYLHALCGLMILSIRRPWLNNLPSRVIIFLLWTGVFATFIYLYFA